MQSRAWRRACFEPGSVRAAREGFKRGRAGATSSQEAATTTDTGGNSTKSVEVDPCPHAHCAKTSQSNSSSLERTSTVRMMHDRIGLNRAPDPLAHHAYDPIPAPGELKRSSRRATRFCSESSCARRSVISCSNCWTCGARSKRPGLPHFGPVRSRPVPAQSPPHAREPSNMAGRGKRRTSEATTTNVQRGEQRPAETWR